MKNNVLKHQNNPTSHNQKLKKELLILNPTSHHKNASCSESCCSTTVTNRSNRSEASPVSLSQQLTYQIEGMDCPACAATLEKGISKLDEIEQVEVNYATGKMHVIASNPQIGTLIPREVRKLGYSVREPISNHSLKIYDIDGMDCGSCATTLENHLKRHPAVKKVKVNFNTGTMHIEHDNSEEEIIKEVAKVGYRAERNQGHVKETEPAPTPLLDPRLMLSGIFLLLGYIGSFFTGTGIISYGLYGLTILLSGVKPAKSAVYALKSRSLDMNVLMTAAVIGAIAIGEWLEAAVVVWLFAFGNTLQMRSIERTRQSIRTLLQLAPPEAWIKEGTRWIRKPVETVATGDLMLVKPGDKIPLDGIIVDGQSTVNQAPITGESLPVDKQAGDMVYAGSMNEHGTLQVEVTKLAQDTTLSKIIQLVEEAQARKAPTQAFVDRFAKIYTPIIFAFALLTMLLPPLFQLGTWENWFYKGLELLVVACPCALVISTPVAIVSAIGNAAKNGILIKGGTFLETAGSITAVAFDKTGTLTQGKPCVTKVVPFESSKNELLTIAYALEDYSNHPIAKAIINYAQEHRISKPNCEGAQSILGKGVQGEIDGERYYAGNLALFQELNTPLEPYHNEIDMLHKKGCTMVLIGTKQKLLGMLAIEDQIRETTSLTLQRLQKVGIDQIIMLTGDHKATAAKIAAQLGGIKYEAELLPEQKTAYIEKLRGQGQTVAMVGDGINDAPALAAADLGIAMGGAGTDAAMETADIVLLADHLDKLPYTVKLSRKSLAIIKQNIWFSILIKIVALFLIFPNVLTLWIAILSDTGAALLVILNSMRLIGVKK